MAETSKGCCTAWPDCNCDEEEIQFLDDSKMTTFNIEDEDDELQ
jgi:hypothetical protein